MTKVERQQQSLIDQFAAENGTVWSDKTREQWFALLRRFHHWLEERHLSIDQLAIEDIESFLRRPCRRRLKSSTYHVYRNMIHPYVRWLRGEKGLRKDSQLIVLRRRWRGPTPRTLQDFLADPEPPRSKRTIENYQSDLCHFHQWLESQRIAIEAVDENHFVSFGQYLMGTGYPAPYRQKSDQRLRIYLYWLHQNGIIRLGNPETCSARQLHGSRVVCDLPREVRAFLEIVAVTRRPGTVINYRAACQHLHAFLLSRNIPLKDVSRKDMEAWVKHLKSLRFSASWRIMLVCRTKLYLGWLRENGLINADPDILLRSTDCPKKPKLLPKPLKPEDDHLLQQELARREDVQCRALLLMRWTGIRIGELVDLEFECVWTDHAGHRYLKVPLGKLNNERMVPIDERVVDLVTWLKARSQALDNSNRTWLLQLRDGRRFKREYLRSVLHCIAREVGIKERVNAHRLRHSYATSLLNGGMSLVGVMRLLGHRSILMTLGYAAVSPESVRDEYLSAICKLNERHQVRAAIEQISEETAFDVIASFAALSRVIRQTAHHKKSNPKAVRLLIKRIHRLQGEIEELFRNSSACP